MPLNLSQGTDDSSDPLLRRHQQQQAHPFPKITIDFETMERWWNQGIGWMQQNLQNRIRLETLRSLPMFLGIHPANLCFSPEAFGPPVKHLDKSTLEKIKSRLSLNLAFFLTNYVLVVVVISSVIALLHPGMILLVGIVYGLWALHTALGPQGQVYLFGLDLQPYLSYNIRARVLTALTVIVVVWKCLWPVIHSVILSTLIIFCHGFLRDPNHIDLEESSDRTKNNHRHHRNLATGYSGSNNGDIDDEEGGQGGGSGGDESESVVLVERPSSSGPTQRRGGDALS